MDTKFIDAVNNHNIIRVRIALANEILLNANGKSFHEMLNFAEQNLSDLYDEHDGEVFVEDYSNFTSNDVADIQNKLDFNFSKERLSYFEKVVRKVKEEKTVDNPSTEKKKTITCDDNILSTSMLIAGGIIITGGIVAAKTIPIVIGSTLAAAGAITLIKNNINR
jgi:hypothetical protein